MHSQRASILGGITQKISRGTIKTKLWFLSALMLANLTIVGVVEFIGLIQIVSQTEEIADVHLPAVRGMTLVDMMHDGIRAVVYRSLAISNSPSHEKEAEEVREEIKEVSKGIETYLSEVSLLKVPAETRAAIEDSRAPLNSYVKVAHEVIALALAGKRPEADALLPRFQEEFEKLE
jgi:methyl-accepting chemotaxis protein